METLQCPYLKLPQLLEEDHDMNHEMMGWQPSGDLHHRVPLGERRDMSTLIRHNRSIPTSRMISNYESARRIGGFLT